MKKSISVKTNFSGSFGMHVPEIIKRFGFKGAANGTVDGTLLVESSVELSVEEYKALYESEKESLDVTSKYLQQNLQKDCEAMMASIKSTAFMFQEMEHELNIRIQHDNADEEKLRETITKERKEREEAAAKEKAAKEKKEKKDE